MLDCLLAPFFSSGSDCEPEEDDNAVKVFSIFVFVELDKGGLEEPLFSISNRMETCNEYNYCVTHCRKGNLIN